MSRIPYLALTLLLASVGGVGVVYMKTRPAEPEAVKLDRVAQAVAATSSAKSFTFTYSMTISGGGESLTMTGDGSFDAKHQLAAMKFRLDGLPGLPAEQAEVELVLDNSDGVVEYLRMPAVTNRLPAGKSWVRIDVGDLAKKQGIDLSRLQQAGNADPKEFFAYLRRAAAPVLVGREDVGGVATTHYRATVDLRRLAAAETDAASREAVERAVELSGISSIPVDAWIDGAGYLRRMRATVPLTVPGSGAEVATMTITEELSGFGSAVAVSVPAADSVVDVVDVAGLARS